MPCWIEYANFFLYLTFFRNIKSDWKFCATLMKVKFPNSRYKKSVKQKDADNMFKCSYFSLFSSKVTYRRIKMQKNLIIKLLLILHETSCFFLPFLTI